MRNQALGLYIHFPFCEQKCWYCDFLTFSHADSLIPSYEEALLRQLQQDISFRKLRGKPLNSVYFGGGTPSLASPSFFIRCKDIINQSFEVMPEIEITVEANPGTLREELVNTWKHIGVNRLSLGVQTTVNRLLDSCGRRHTRETVEEDLILLNRYREASGLSLNFDFIYGLFEQGEEDIRQDLSFIEKWKPNHVSWYSLILEERSRFGVYVRQGKYVPPSDETMDLLEKTASQGLRQLGYEQYEISNFARNGAYSRHNRKYWTGQPYLGIGLGAASYLEGRRSQCADTFSKYFEAVHQQLPAWMEEPYSQTEEAFDEVMMGFRLLEGISRDRFRKKYGWDFVETYAVFFEKWRSADYVDWNEARIWMTEKGLNFQNIILSDLLEIWRN